MCFAAGGALPQQQPVLLSQGQLVQTAPTQVMQPAQQLAGPSQMIGPQTLALVQDTPPVQLQGVAPVLVPPQQYQLSPALGRRTICWLPQHAGCHEGRLWHVCMCVRVAAS